MKKKTKKVTALALRAEKPKVPKKWNYNKSVKKMKQFIYKWKTLTEKMRDELWIAREKLSKSGAAGHVKNLSVRNLTLKKTWSQYCIDIGSTRQSVDSWLHRAFGPLKFSEQKYITGKGRRTKKIRKHVSPGQLWILGRHRLLCGDSRKKADVEWLFDGQHADICFTSPPYNLGEKTQSGKPRGYKDNLSPKKYLSLLMDFTSLAIDNCEYVFVNLQQCVENKSPIDEYLYAYRNLKGGTMIWDKIHPKPSRVHNVCDSQFEFVFYFNEQGKKQINTGPFKKSLSDVICTNSKQDKQYSYKHKATFPVKFAAHFVKYFAEQNHIVYDAFCGTGSTLIACQKLKRRCYAMEINYKYCNMIIDRWENETNGVALLCERDGTVWHPDYPESKTLWPYE